MPERIYVALDLETTGLDPKRDAIIEIGAVCFQGDQVLDRFVTFVNPQRAIPLRIQQLTGIRNRDVSAAPTAVQVAPELLSFVHRDVTAVVAHNAGFDMGFLRTAGINFQRPVLDTFELATILLPNQASYSLGHLCHEFAIVLDEAHRALDDANATARLFMLLQKQTKLLPTRTLQLLVESAQGVDWPPLALFEQTLATASKTEQKPHLYPFGAAWPQVNQQPSALSSPPSEILPEKPKLSAQTAEALFAASGALAQLMGPAYEMRIGQVQMAKHVADALMNGDHLILEAGTGTGKSLAYLAPAALWSVMHGQRVVIATNTIPLQDQLLAKEIPQVQQMLNSIGYAPPAAALLKGRSNYLCTRRLHAWRKNHPLTAAELTLLAKVLIWLPTTQNGDVSELFLANALERALWMRICSDAATCMPERCNRKQTPDLPDEWECDFYDLAHQRANDANLLVVNHALLVANLVNDNQVIPPFNNLIVDEAHRLDESATDQLTQRIELPAIHNLLKGLSFEEHLLVSVRQLLIQRGLVETVPTLEELERSAKRVRQRIQDFGDRLLYFVQHQQDVRPDIGYVQQIRLNTETRAQAQWSQLEAEWQQTGHLITPLLERLATILKTLEAARWRQEESSAALYNDLQGIYQQLSERVSQMDLIVFQENGSNQQMSVTWMELNETGDQVALLAAPLYVNEILEKELAFKQRCAIFTGATLRTGSGFRFIRDRLGLWHAGAISVDSPFDYEQSTLLYTPHDMPPPDHAYYQQAVERAIVDAAHATGGRMLVLFTSYSQLRATAEAIRAQLDREGITLLEHGVGSRNRLLREYRQAEKAVLLGTRSFWEGVDLPGDELRCLVIVRLPFAVPSDPLISARCADLEDPFNEYMLPDAILRFRQGFGRLIRRASDRGVVVLLDSRLWRKEYGRAFLESLPTCTTSRAPLANLRIEISNWLA